MRGRAAIAARLGLAAVVCLTALGACSNQTDTTGPATAPSVIVGPTTTPPTTAPVGTAPAGTGTIDPGTDVTTTAAGATAVPSSTAAPPSTLQPAGDLELSLEVVAEGFSQPVFVTSAPGDPALYVVDQDGVIWRLEGGEASVYLDISDRVRFGGEQGLLGLAFAADHASTGHLFVDYTASDGTTHIARFTADGGSADPGLEQILLEIPQPASNHNGGMIAFGPDGNLWIGMGDGGRADDAFGNGQDGSTLLGAMLRITPGPDGGYTIPADNPAVTGEGPGWADEVWAIGLRNPWRWSFDGDELWIGDVGQNEWEEVDRISATAGGSNLGWPLFEGSHCYLSDCDDTGLVAPVHEYSHGDGQSITGGYVYRGAAIPELDGHFFFGDYVGGWISTVDQDGAVTEWFPPGTIAGLSSFGVGPDGEMYVAGTNGTVWRVVRAG